MESQRWFLLALLSFSMVGTIVYYWTLGKRLSRLKKILDKSPKVDGPALAPAPRGGQTVSAALPASQARPGKEGVSIGSLFGQEVEWVEESGIDGQRKSAANVPHKSHESGVTMLDRVGSVSPMDLLTPRSSVPPAAAEGDLLKKLLSFDSPGQAPESPPAHTPVAIPPLPPLKRERPMDLFKAAASEARGEAAGSQTGGALGRLGAFATGEAGAPESAKLKASPQVKAPSFSLGPSPLAARMEKATGEPLPALGLGRGGASKQANDSGEAAALLAAEKSKVVLDFDKPAGTGERAEQPPAGSDSLRALMSFGAKGGDSAAIPSARHAATSEPHPPAADSAKPGSVLGRLGSPLLRLGKASHVEQGAGPSDLLARGPDSSEAPRGTAARSDATLPHGGAGGSLMSRLGKPADGGASEPPIPPGNPLARLVSPAKATQEPAAKSPGSVLGKLLTSPGPAQPAARPTLKFGAASSSAPAAAPGGFAGLAKLGQPASEKPRTAAVPSALGNLFKKAPPVPKKPALDIAALEQKFIEDQNDMEAKRALAEAYLAAGQLDNAVEAFTELIETPAKQESDIFNLGLAFKSQGQSEGATMCFTELTELHKGSPWAMKASLQLLGLKTSKTKPEGKPRDKKIRLTAQNL